MSNAAAWLFINSSLVPEYLILSEPRRYFLCNLIFLSWSKERRGRGGVIGEGMVKEDSRGRDKNNLTYFIRSLGHLTSTEILTAWYHFVCISAKFG